MRRDDMSSAVRFGIVGLRHGLRHVRGWERPGESTVVAVCDVDSGRADAALADAGPGCVATVRFDQLVEDPRVQAVVISVPNDAHAELAERALLANKHVAVEKPMTTTGNRARELVRLAEDRGLVLAALHDFRADPAHWAARELVRGGGLGEVYFARTMWVRRDNAPGSWYRDRARAGGGVLMDLGTHRIDLALWTLGFPDVRELTAATSSRLLQLRCDGGDVEDTAVGMLHLDNDASVQVELSFLGHLPRREQVLLELRGTQAALRVANIGDSYRHYLLTVLRDGNNPQHIDPEQVPSRAPSMYSDFVAAIRTGGRPLCPGSEAAVVAEVIDRMYAAAAAVTQPVVR
ncbi:Gfo/Idh/MocA family protein [Nocardia terpenica]|nr:Gfo/Idh/MocA family oxidoreductase [Nocardia terpenica]NQE89543.1 Gfo/Idh/MocA family oxidoreductase [Nocardia terpenica]